MSNARYIQYPVFLFQNLLIEKEKTLDTILVYGIYQFALKIKYTYSDVAKNLIYHNYKGSLPVPLAKKLNNQKYKWIGQVTDYQCFNVDGAFEPYEEEVEELLLAFEDGTDLMDLAIEFYQIVNAHKLLGVRGSFEHNLRQGKRLAAECQIKGEPMAMLNLKLLFEFRDKPKTEVELMEFAFYIGIKSILGKKQVTKTNIRHILSRALGYKSVSAVPEKVLEGEIFIKYSKRYYYTKILKNLEASWYLKQYSKKIRGIYVSIGSDVTYEYIIRIAETGKKSYKENQVKRAKAIALNTIRQELKIV